MSHSDIWLVRWLGELGFCGLCAPVELATRLYPCSWSMPYEPSLARALAAHERAVRRGPDPVK
jgi:hypothetical protein